MNKMENSFPITKVIWKSKSLLIWTRHGYGYWIKRYGNGRENVNQPWLKTTNWYGIDTHF